MCAMQIEVQAITKEMPERAKSQSKTLVTASGEWSSAKKARPPHEIARALANIGRPQVSTYLKAEGACPWRARAPRVRVEP